MAIINQEMLNKDCHMRCGSGGAFCSWELVHTIDSKGNLLMLIGYCRYEKEFDSVNDVFDLQVRDLKTTYIPKYFLPGSIFVSSSEEKTLISAKLTISFYSIRSATSTMPLPTISFPLPQLSLPPFEQHDV